MRGITFELKQKLAAALQQAAERARAAGELTFEKLPEIELELPKEKEHGDLASNLALVLARQAKKAPRAVAESLLRHFSSAGTWVERVEVAGPGFINFFLDPGWLYLVPRLIEEQGEGYGRTDVGQGQKVMVEFVSANPTGPLVLVSARAAAVGDTLANLLDWAGFQVHREFYINDAGNQVSRLAQSLEIRLRQQLGEELPFPEDGYPGEYLIDLARQLLEEEGARVLDLPEDERRRQLADYAVTKLVAEQKKALAEYGVNFDRWFSERSLHETGAVREVIEILQARGLTYEQDGALWFKSTAFGDDKDRVLVKSDGEYTYFVPDIAYHLNKYRRGFDRVIDLLGPDHHGYFGRLRAAVEALGYPGDSLEIMIVQLVRLVRQGQAVRMSKRRGEFVTMEELVSEVGKDAARFFFLMRSADSPMDFDLDLAQLQGNENPVFYVQYAHARIASLLRQAQEVGAVVPAAAATELGLLASEEEKNLLKKLAEFPEEVLEAALAREPHRMTRYLLELAGLFHYFYTRHRVLGEKPEVMAARLVLAKVTGQVLRNALGLIGVTAPERM